MASVISATTESLWTATADAPMPAALHGDTEADVCIVGGGIAGVTTAYLLGRLGKKVVLIDDGPIASGQTRNTTAHLSSAIDDRFTEIERMHGEEGARLAAESHSGAIDEIERTVREEAIDCDFQRLDGYLFAPPEGAGDLLDAELDAARRAGLQVSRVDRAPLGSFDTGPCLRFADQAQFHPLKYLARLVAAIRRDGGRVYGYTHATHLEGGDAARVETDGGHTISAGAVVVATNTPINDRVAIHTKQAPYLTYVIGCPVPRGSIERALYWDTLDPYHYVRLQSDNGVEGPSDTEILIVGGEDHKTGQAHDGEARFDRLERWAAARFGIDPFQVSYRWMGQVMETVDGLAFIGHNPMDKDNVYVATGDSGMGMTHGTIAGILLSQLIVGNDHPWRALYDPSRKTLRALGTFARENLNVAAEYGAWLTGGDVATEEEIAAGTGAVIRRGLQKIAVYRGEDGSLSRCSAVCPHLKCIVTWNRLDRTWDCPCHGSRFDCDGHVISGPANSDLAPVAQLQGAPDAELGA